MKLMFSAAMSAAAAAAMTVGALAQSQQPPTSGSSQSTASAQQQVTMTGCVQREADYRRAQDAGQGGVAGTGAGGANEFVLVNASTSSGATAGTSATGTTGTTGTSATSATSRSTAGETAYELTGSGEGQAASYVGRRVEITGKLKPAETTASDTPTGGATAGRPPTGVDVTSKDLKLRELEVSTVREASGTCPSR
jgi:collagen type VII alpha